MKKTSTNIKSNIQKMYLVRFLRQMQFFGAVAVPFFLDWAQIGYTKIFLLEAAFMLFIFLSEIPTGIIADKYGRKTSILLGGLCSVVSFLIFGLINDYLVFFVAELIGALAATLFSGADKALIYDTLLSVKEEKEGKVILSRHEAAGTIGTVLGLTSGSMIAGSSILPYPQTLPLTMILSAVTSLLAVFVAFTLKEPQRKEKPKEAFLKVGIEGFKYIFKTPKLRVFALNFALISAATFFMFWLYQSLTRMIGLDIEWNGVVGAGFNLFAILLLLNIKRIEKWFGIRRVLFYSALIPGLFFLGLGFTENTLFVLVAIFAITSMKLMRAPVLADFMNKHIESKNRATVLSGVSMLNTICIAILYPIVGILADYSLHCTFVLLGVVTLALSFLSKIEAKHI